jgi:hypothetical protein
MHVFLILFFIRLTEGHFWLPVYKKLINIIRCALKRLSHEAGPSNAYRLMNRPKLAHTVCRVES